MDGMELSLGARFMVGAAQKDIVVISENDEAIMETICYFSDAGHLSRWIMKKAGGPVI
jgi:hypothetical protein